MATTKLETTHPVVVMMWKKLTNSMSGLILIELERIILWSDKSSPLYNNTFMVLFFEKLSHTVMFGDSSMG